MSVYIFISIMCPCMSAYIHVDIYAYIHMYMHIDMSAHMLPLVTYTIKLTNNVPTYVRTYCPHVG